MPHVVIEQPGVPPMRVPLVAAETTFGRADDNDVVLVADEVSRHHAKIVQRGQQYLVVDLKSLNGTYVNRQRIMERLLSHQDELWMGGKCRMIYGGEPETQAKQEEGAKESSTLFTHLSKIREEMDAAGSHLTMIANADAQAPKSASREDLEKMGRAYRRLNALYEASKHIASNFSLNQRLAAVLDTAMEVMGAERGFILLRDEGSQGLRVSMARGMDKDMAMNSPSMGIASRAAIDGEPVLMSDASKDKEFGSRKSIIQQRISGAMCVPLKVEDRMLGSIYIDTRNPSTTFADEDLELFLALASQSAMAIENVRFYQRMVESEKKRANLGRFLSPSIVDVIMKEDRNLELGGQVRVVTTLFADIRGFTPMSEKMPPDQLIELLNEHFTAMTECVFQYHGTLDKYNGDEVMALFGAPLGSNEDARWAVSAALAMQAKNRELNEKRKDRRLATFDVGIGINTGEAVAGFVGSPDRMDFTVLGDAVNTASRLCSLAGPNQICIGDRTYETIKDFFETKSLGSSDLKGKAEQVQAYEVLGVKTPAETKIQ